MLGVEVTSKGFSFAVLEGGGERLIDWGGREVKGSDIPVFLGKLGRVVDRYRPDLMALEEPAGSRRQERVRERLVWAEQYGVDHGVRCRAITQEKLLAYLPAQEKPGVHNSCKQLLAETVARAFPEMARSLPRPRRTWESEARSMAVFVAIARACVAGMPCAARLHAPNGEEQAALQRKLL